ncbi:hypothetical protein ANCCAN_16053 [Ancylostoma caninum]|uniref:Uncharacterized protein n=1 Tax=Ancylostoma caninum TaxID=29170 RepID=A0A368G0Y7_ANCCA|nr:hypothetical protein ANCCAN_16053 [Ancylostoma caninum]
MSRATQGKRTHMTRTMATPVQPTNKLLAAHTTRARSSTTVRTLATINKQATTKTQDTTNRPAINMTKRRSTLAMTNPQALTPVTTKLAALTPDTIKLPLDNSTMTLLLRKEMATRMVHTIRRTLATIRLRRS